LTCGFTTRPDIAYSRKGPFTVVTQALSAHAQVIRHLQRLKRELKRRGVIAEIKSEGGSRVWMSVPGVEGDFTCRANPRDANHLWYVHDGTPLTPAGDDDQACEAATKILTLAAEASTR
jgi:hypothetical protein